MIVVDTPIIAYMTFETRFSGVVSQLHQKNSVWEAPSPWKSEFLNILARYLRKGVIDYQGSLNALDFADAVVSSSCSAYDCEFIALADKLRTKLVTYDKNLIREFPNTAISPEAYLVPVYKVHAASLLPHAKPAKNAKN